VIRPSASPAAGGAPTSALHQAATQLESLLVKQLLTASGAFHGDSSVAGSTLTKELFADTLAQAVASAGGLGLAPLLEQSLGGAASSGQSPATTATHLPPGVTSGFGERLDPLTGKRSEHTGVDLGAPEGTPVPAAKDGVVVAAGARGGYGNAVEVAHADGSTTLYAHLSQVNAEPGDQVQEGETLGLVGQTGRTTGPHLHLEVRKAGHFLNPGQVLKAYRLRAENAGGGEP
jgi:murein DD-endopeptidase MepM/ murein hydrolase activator NlpD